MTDEPIRRIIKQPDATVSYGADTVAALNRKFGAQNVALLRKMALAEHMNDGSAQRLHDQNYVVSVTLVSYMVDNNLMSSDEKEPYRAARTKLIEIFIKG